MKHLADARPQSGEAFDEQAIARRIVASLNAGVHELDERSVRRLRAARERALAARNRPVGPLRRLRALFAADGLLCPRNVVAAALVCVLALAGNLWSGWSGLVDLDDIDTALLADELPIDAYLDADFSEWLQHDSPS